jgi:hypothetical protein
MAAPDRYDWKSDYRVWLPLLCSSWALAVVFQDQFISDWDGFDYAAYTVQNVPSALGLGRALFLAYNHLLWKLANYWLGTPPEQAYEVIKYGVMAQSGPAVVGFYAFYKELTAERRAALLATLMLALSPLFLVYSGRGMSEIPAFLLLGWSLWWMLRSLRLGQWGSYLMAAALMGLSANVREFALFYLPVVPLAARAYGRSWPLCLTALGVACLAALAGPLFWGLYAPDYYIPSVKTWYQLSLKERQLHPVTWRNLWFLLAYALICSPSATLLTPLAFKRLLVERTQAVLGWFGIFGLLADLLLLANHDLAVNPRYLLTGLIGLAAISGWWLAEWLRQARRGRRSVLAILTALTLASVIGAGIYAYTQGKIMRETRHYITKIASLPSNAVFIVGAHTPLVNFYRGIGSRPQWKTIAAGAGWPDEQLGEVIDGYLQEGRPVYVDFDPKLWPKGMRERSREAAGLEMIKREYRLESVTDSLYRIMK